MRRRDFWGAPLLGAAAAAPGSGAQSNHAVIETPHVKLAYALEEGRFTLFGRRGSPLLVNAVGAAVFPRGEALTSDANYRRTAAVDGERLSVKCSDTNRVLDFECGFTLLKDRPGAVFELILANVSGKEVAIRRSEPVRALLDDDAGCYYGARQVLTHGYMHHDPGGLMELGSPAREFMSHWNAALYSGGRGALIVGHLDNTDAEGQIAGGGQMTRGGPVAAAGLNLVARSQYGRYFVLSPGARVSSGRLLVLDSPDPFTGLEDYAAMCGRLHGVKLNPIINGWCSWFYTHLTATEDEQLRNAEFIARHLKPYGMEWVQIDDGYQRAFGDWEGNSLYPHGMKWLATEIRRMGLKPGIWIAPHVIDGASEVARKHPEWLLHDSKGRPQPAITSRTKGAYSLDITHPDARRWLYDLFRTVRHDWGYDFIKLDFPGWTILAAERYFDASKSKAQAYRLFLTTVREVAGRDCHIVDCGPGSLGVGLVDSMRIEQDSGLLDWRHYAKRFNSNAPSAAIRYYFHNRTWINDADHLGLALMPLPQAKAAASVIALSGGTMISGDRLFQLDPDRLEILKKVLPAYGEAARPADLFEKSYPEIFALRVRKNFATWIVAGYFNWDEGAEATRELSFARLGLDPAKSYLLYEFWSQRFLGEMARTCVLRFEPSSVNLLAIRESTGVPQVIGTDRHYTQGGVELEDVHWNASARKLSGVALGASGSSWRMAIHVPAGYSWRENDPEHFRDAGAYTAIRLPGAPLRVTLDFSKSERIAWEFQFS